jgi:hypothetical protein
MADFASIKDIGSIVRGPLAVSIFDSTTAGGAGDNTAVVGSTIDRMDPNTGGIARSAAYAIAWKTVLGANNTLTLKTISVQTSADGTNWVASDQVFADPGVVATGPGGGGTVEGQTTFNIHLGSMMRFFRLTYTPDLSAANTDTSILVDVVVLAGYDRLPV